MKRPRVMHIIGCLAPYGSERSMLNVCLSLRDRYEPIVLAFGGGTLARTLADEGIQFETMSSAETEEGSLWRRFEFCRNRIRRYQPDLVHTHYAYSNVLGRLAAHMQGIPTVGHIRGPERLSGTLLYRTAYRVAHHGRTRLVAVSRGLADVVEAATGLRPLTIYNAVDEAALFPESGVPADLNRELGVDDGAYLVGTVGRVEPRKDYPSLLRCAQKVCRAAPDLHFVCVGDGRQREDMERLRDEMGLSGRVHFLGYRDDIGAILQRLDVFISTALAEGLPRVVLEAMWAGLPVVGTRVLGTEETIIDGQQGFLVPAGDDEAMAERILQLYRDPQLREQMGQQAYERVRDKFSLDALARSIDALYRELLGMP
ncbi:MAG: glycosyltransferase [Armatimonadetes bacterium]|nr:glycosyltransferase [Armatimonadota bacterium]